MKCRKGLLVLALSGILAMSSGTMSAYAVAISPDSGGTVVTEGDRPSSTVTIENDDVPLAALPEGPMPLTALSEEDVPLYGLPKTGDAGRTRLWLMLFIGSGAGIACLTLQERKARRNKGKS